MHWAFDYIGTPWTRDGNDCWQFFRRVQAERFGRVIPAFDMASHRAVVCARAVAENPERANWRPVDRPQEGDAVLMAHASPATHIGLWIDVDGGGVLHCLNGPGVVFQKPAQLKAARWGHLEYYRHV